MYRTDDEDGSCDDGWEAGVKNSSSESASGTTTKGLSSTGCRGPAFGRLIFCFDVVAGCPLGELSSPHNCRRRGFEEDPAAIREEMAVSLGVHNTADDYPSIKTTYSQMLSLLSCTNCKSFVSYNSHERSPVTSLSSSSLSVTTDAK